MAPENDQIVEVRCADGATPAEAQEYEARRKRVVALAGLFGLTGTGLVAAEDEAQEVNERFTLWYDTLKPFGHYDVWVAEQICDLSIQIQNLRRQEVVIKRFDVEAARSSWALDRMIEAAELASKLARNPEVVALRLRKTAAGVALLIDRWDSLAAIFRAKGAWDDAQRGVALDLLGVPKALRNGPTRLGPESGPAAVLGLIDGELEALRRLKPGLDVADERARAATELGLGRPSKELGAVRRQIASCQRRLEWFRRQLNKGGRETLPDRPKPDRNSGPYWYAPTPGCPTVGPVSVVGVPGFPEGVDRYDESPAPALDPTGRRDPVEPDRRE